MPDSIRVMLVDDHPVTRVGLNAVLQDAEGIEVVAQAADGEQAVVAAQEYRPDVIVMDLIMPRKNGVDACREILESLPTAKVLMITAATDDRPLLDAIAAGARGFIHKYVSGAELIKAVRRTARGLPHIPEEFMPRLIEWLRDPDVASRGAEALTPRQREFLTLFASGMSYGQIAGARGVSATTVRNSIYRIQDRLGLDSKQEIVVWAVRNGLLDSDKERLLSPARPDAERSATDS